MIVSSVKHEKSVSQSQVISSQKDSENSQCKKITVRMSLLMADLFFFGLRKGFLPK